MCPDVHCNTVSNSQDMEAASMSINRGIDKEDMRSIDRQMMEYYSAMKRNEIMPLAGMWLELEAVIQSEVNQKQKNEQCVLTHLCRIQKNGIDELIYKAEIETQTQRTSAWTSRGEGGGVGLEGRD